MKYLATIFWLLADTVAHSPSRLLHWEDNALTASSNLARCICTCAILIILFRKWNLIV
jgi:hypothetical protein